MEIVLQSSQDFKVTAEATEYAETIKRCLEWCCLTPYKQQHIAEPPPGKWWRGQESHGH